jgi:polyisoprenoid-binding protein YceI
MKTAIKWLICFLGVMSLCYGSLAFAAVTEWTILTSDSKLTFTGEQNGSPTTGGFKQFSGSVFFDPDKLNESHVKITVDTHSVYTTYADFTEGLMESDWLSVKVFPQAVFEAKQFKKTGDKAFEATGTLTIRDHTQPVVIAFKAQPLSDKQVLVTGETTIKRVLFGVGQGDWKSTDEVKDDVKINFTLKAEKK